MIRHPVRTLCRPLVRSFALAALLAAAPWIPPGGAAAAELAEPPLIAARVESGRLPPMAERLPESPMVVPLDGPDLALGEYGGRMNLLMGVQRDIRMMTVYGYARLVGYDRELELIPDILESYEVEKGGRVFTFHLRPGHRWSDGHPFTAEDFRYFWEDVANNETLSQFGPPKIMIVGDEVPRFEVLDEHTVRYSWSTPNPYFLPALAGASPLFIYRPAHYLKQFHERYADREKLQAMVEEMGQRNWAGVHHRMDEQYRLENVDMPTLGPWINTTAPPSDRFVFKRNPYYHRVDPEGRQLPYIDEVIISVVDSGLIPAKTGFGESDLQGRYISFDDYTFLKQGEKDRGFDVRLWPTGRGSIMALFPNLNAQDEVWRTLNRDVRFRRALSLAIDRQAINQVLFFGLAQPSANTVLPDSPLFKPEYREAYTGFDVARANALLDEIGLTERDGGGLRRLPDGRPLQIVVDTRGEGTQETDILELIKKEWSKIGIGLFPKPSQREVFRNRVYSGQAVMSVWWGLDNAIPTAETSPMEFVPTAQDQLQWPKWGEYFETGGGSGAKPDMQVGRDLLELNRAWRFAETKEERREIWHEILSIHADQVLSIGTVNGVPQPVVVSEQLRNVPEKGLFNWDPGAFFGIYRPDTFWFEAPRRQAAR
ncbi:MAG TPA: ABC transporter substrate-binding protein [Kiloniellales bacterium]|nr:ABC transporter substrate-binding protein [Kiloniellales bacterium]